VYQLIVDVLIGIAWVWAIAKAVKTWQRQHPPTFRE